MNRTTEDFAKNELHRSSSAGDNSHIFRLQSSQSKKLNFFSWPDLAYSFANKTSGYEIIKTCKLVAICYANRSCKSTKKNNTYILFRTMVFMLTNQHITFFHKHSVHFEKNSGRPKATRTYGIQGAQHLKVRVSGITTNGWPGSEKLPILIIYHKNPTR